MKRGPVLQRALAPAAIALFLAACGGDVPSSAQSAAESASTAVGGATGDELAAEQVLRRGNGAEPQTLDPHKAEGVPSSNIQRDLYEGLVGKAPNGDLVPGAAESWTISDDGLVYTFELRESARWSNGDPVTADDFVYSLRRSVDPATLSRYSFMLRPIVNAEAITDGQAAPETLGVTALDTHSLEIRLRAPTPYFLGVLTHSAAYPVHRPTVEAHGDRWARPGTLVSNGAYKLDDWVVQSHIKLVRNPQYWDDANTTIEEVYYYAIENQATELKRYRANELDITNELPYKQLTWIRENVPDELTIAPYLGIYYYGFNVTRPPFEDNLPLRKALALAIDREIITGRVTAAGEIPAYGWVPEVSNYTQQRPEWAAWSKAEREAEAKRLYAEAGYSEADPLEVQILYNTHENHKTIAVAVASMWKQVLGVETELLNEEWKVFLETRRKRETTEVFRAGWIGDYDDAYTFAELMHSENDLNDSGWVNPRYDELLELASNEGDLAERARYLQEAEQVLLEDLPIIPIYFYVTKRLVKPWVGGYENNIMDHHYTKDMFILAH
jgi:oligopeptide transport system substrate-binding protein